MSTYLVISTADPTLEQIQQKINNFATLADLSRIHSQDSKAIGIDKSREIIKFAQKKPMGGQQKLVVIFDSHKLTDEAQNALLKTLEEHATYLDIVLVAKSENGLLDTVLSRCKKLNIQTTTPKEYKKSALELKDLEIGQSLGFAQKVAKLEKEEIVSLFQNWATEQQKTGNYKKAQLLLDTADELTSLSINTRLAIEYMFLKMC